MTFASRLVLACRSIGAFLGLLVSVHATSGCADLYANSPGGGAQSADDQDGDGDESASSQPAPQNPMDAFQHGLDTAPTWDTSLQAQQADQARYAAQAQASAPSSPSSSSSTDDDDNDSSSFATANAQSAHASPKPAHDDAADRAAAQQAAAQQAAAQKQKEQDEARAFVSAIRSGVRLSVVTCSEADAGYYCVRAAGPNGVSQPKNVSAVYLSVRASCDGIVWTSSVSTHGSYLGYKTMPETMPLRDKLSCKASEARAEVTDVHL